MSGGLDADLLARIDQRLAETDEVLATAYPGPGGRQPVHTVYVPADADTEAVPARWGAQAIELAQEHGGLEQLCRTVGLPDTVAAQVAPRVEAKLAGDPVEDLRIDFEDGYGQRPDEEHDADVRRAVLARRVDEQAGRASTFWGVRIPCLEADTRARGLRTLELVVAELVRTGGLPEGLRLTLPKVSTAAQVEAFVWALEALEAQHGLGPGALRFEIQVETPQLILGREGVVELAPAVRAGGDRVTGLHYGTYDYSASMQVAAAHQAMDHPVADQAKAMMQLVVAGTAIELSDGSTNITPTGDPEQRAQAWALHARLVTRSLRQGIYQGWDMHPGHLATRYVATYAFYREGLEAAGDRVGAAVHQIATAVLDEPATLRALARYLHRGHTCGAVDEGELLGRAGLDAAAVERLARPRSDTAAIIKEARS